MRADMARLRASDNGVRELLEEHDAFTTTSYKNLNTPVESISDQRKSYTTTTTSNELKGFSLENEVNFVRTSLESNNHTTSTHSYAGTLQYETPKTPVADRKKIQGLSESAVEVLEIMKARGKGS